ncbi:AT rich interactive domain 1A [Planoprotostelium fungivorum]|uniref:AT rich interactive domain 1A n=1 Tax=Planoprotostelium fungivorum TaxID=1890364 RepID=A0A2P6NYD8_9EUKA|nr:AT rich interactive domain 1A [Planoprotostelium fungivorum]
MSRRDSLSNTQQRTRSKSAPPKKDWDSSVSDLSVHKLSSQEAVQRKMSMVSRNLGLARAELQQRQQDLRRELTEEEEDDDYEEEMDGDSLFLATVKPQNTRREAPTQYFRDYDPSSHLEELRNVQPTGRSFQFPADRPSVVDELTPILQRQKAIILGTPMPEGDQPPPERQNRFYNDHGDDLAGIDVGEFLRKLNMGREIEEKMRQKEISESDSLSESKRAKPPLKKAAPPARPTVKKSIPQAKKKKIEIEVLPPRRLIEKRPAEESVAQRTKGKATAARALPQEKGVSVQDIRQILIAVEALSKSILDSQEQLKKGEEEREKLHTIIATQNDTIKHLSDRIEALEETTKLLQQQIEEQTQNHQTMEQNHQTMEQNHQTMERNNDKKLSDLSQELRKEIRQQVEKNLQDLFVQLAGSDLDFTSSKPAAPPHHRSNPYAYQAPSKPTHVQSNYAPKPAVRQNTMPRQQIYQPMYRQPTTHQPHPAPVIRQQRQPQAPYQPQAQSVPHYPYSQEAPVNSTRSSISDTRYQEPEYDPDISFETNERIAESEDDVSMISHDTDGYESFDSMPNRREPEMKQTTQPREKVAGARPPSSTSSLIYTMNNTSRNQNNRSQPSRPSNVSSSLPPQQQEPTDQDIAEEYDHPFAASKGKGLPNHVNNKSMPLPTSNKNQQPFYAQSSQGTMGDRSQFGGKTVVVNGAVKPTNRAIPPRNPNGQPQQTPFYRN